MMVVLDECEFSAEPKVRAKIIRVKIAVPPLLRTVFFITSAKKVGQFQYIFYNKISGTFLLVG